MPCLLTVLLLAPAAHANDLAQIETQTDPAPATEQPSPQQPAVEQAPPTPAEILADPHAPRQARIAAATELIDAIDRSEALGALWQALVDPERTPIVLEAIARRGSPPRVLWTHVRAAADQQIDPRTLAAAIGAFRSPDAVRTLIALARDSAPGERRDAARARLAELFNTPEVAFDDAGLAEWLEARSAWGDDRWRDALARAQLDRLRNERARADRAERRLVEFARRSWIAAADPEREALLGDLLRSDVDALRSLASELIRELIASGKAVPTAVQNDTISLLASDKPAVRADAATLVVQVAPQSAGPAVLEALIRERDPRVAEPLLIAFTRWPTPEAVEPVLGWLERGGRTAVPAADAVLALQRADLLVSDEIRERVRSALRSMDPKLLNGSACHLLVAIGDQDDAANVRSLLQAERPALRQSAAAALATRPEHVDALLEAATGDPLLIETAARAVQTHRATPDGIRALDSLLDASPNTVARIQQAIARELPINQVLELAERFEDPCRKADALAVLAERKLPEDAGPDQQELHENALRALAYARYHCGQAAQAIAAFTLLDPSRLTDEDRHTLARARIRTADYPAALNLAIPIAIWLEEHTRLDDPEDAEQRAALAGFILEHLAEALPPEILETLQRELAGANGDNPDLVQADPPATNDPGGD